MISHDILLLVWWSWTSCLQWWLLQTLVNLITLCTNLSDSGFAASGESRHVALSLGTKTGLSGASADGRNLSS